MRRPESRTSSTEAAGLHLRNYQDLIDEVPNPHLVVATVRTKAALEAAKQLLARLLLKVLKPQGLYALTTLEDGQDFAVYCVFELENDAVKLGMATWAARVSRYAGFSSQRAFVLDQEAQEAIKASLAGEDD